MKPIRILWLVLSLAVLAWGASRLLGGPEKAIHRRLDALADVIAKEGPESDLVAAARSRELLGFFADAFRLHAPQVGSGEITDRARLAQTFLGYRRRYERIEASFRAREVELGPGGQGARLACVATFAGDGVDLTRDRYRLVFDWRLVGGDWKIETVELVEILEGGLSF